MLTLVHVVRFALEVNFYFRSLLHVCNLELTFEDLNLVRVLRNTPPLSSRRKRTFTSSVREERDLVSSNESQVSSIDALYYDVGSSSLRYNITYLTIREQYQFSGIYITIRSCVDGCSNLSRSRTGNSRNSTENIHLFVYEVVVFRNAGWLRTAGQLHDVHEGILFVSDVENLIEDFPLIEEIDRRNVLFRD